MFQDATLKPLLTEESYTLHGKEAQHFFINKLYTAARRGDKFRELVQDVFENVRSTLLSGSRYSELSGRSAGFSKRNCWTPLFAESLKAVKTS